MEVEKLKPITLNGKDKLLHDGEIIYPFTIEIEYGKVLLKFNVDNSQYISELKDLVGEDNFRLILDEIKSAKESVFPGNYNGTDSLPLRFNLSNDTQYILIHSYGEYQPQRYKLYLESLWKKT